MGFFSGITKAVGGIVGSVLGGGGSSSTAVTTKNNTTVSPVTNVTNKIDLEPLGRILADSQNKSNALLSRTQIASSNIISQAQKASANTLSNVLNDVAQTDNETAKIELLNSELDRQANSKALTKLDEYLENGKKGLVISAIVAGLLYVYKK